MSTLLDLKTIQDAYDHTSRLQVARKMICLIPWRNRFAFAACVLIVCALAFWGIRADRVDVALFPGIALALIWEYQRRTAFKRFYEENPEIIRTFQKYDQGLRYLLFKERLPKDLRQNTKRISTLSDLLAKRQQVRTASTFSRRPLVSVLLGILAFLAAAVFQHVPAQVTVPIALVISILLGFLILNLRMTADMWRTRAYKDAELSEFVLWLGVEADEVAAPSESESP